MERLENPWHAEMCRGTRDRQIGECANCGKDIMESSNFECDKYHDGKLYCEDCAPVGYCNVCMKPLYWYDDYEVDPFNEAILYCKECEVL